MKAMSRNVSVRRTGALLACAALLLAPCALGAAPRAVEGVWDYYFEMKESGFRPFSNMSNELSVVARRGADSVVVRSRARAAVFFRALPLVGMERSGAEFARNLEPAYYDAAKNEKLAAFAAELFKGAGTVDEVVERTAVWVRNSIVYSLGSPTDPLGVIAAKRAFCMGYASVFVHLLRAGGVEARSLSCWVPQGKGWGFGESGGDHAFLEYFYPGYGWVCVDPQSSCNFVDPYHLTGLDSSDFLRELEDESSFALLGALPEPKKWATYLWTGLRGDPGPCAIVSIKTPPSPSQGSFRPTEFGFLRPDGSRLPSDEIRVPSDGHYSHTEYLMRFDRQRRLLGVEPVKRDYYSAYGLGTILTKADADPSADSATDASKDARKEEPRPLPGDPIRTVIWKGSCLSSTLGAMPDEGDLVVAADFRAAADRDYLGANPADEGGPGSRARRLLLYGPDGSPFPGGELRFSLHGIEGTLYGTDSSLFVDIEPDAALKLEYGGNSVELRLSEAPERGAVPVFPSPAAREAALARLDPALAARAPITPSVRVFGRDEGGFLDPKAFDSIALFDPKGKQLAPSKGSSGEAFFEKLLPGAAYVLLCSRGDRHVVRSLSAKEGEVLVVEVDPAEARFLEIRHADPARNPAKYALHPGGKISIPLAARDGRILLDPGDFEPWIGEGEDLSSVRRLDAASGAWRLVYDPWLVDPEDQADFRTRVRGEGPGFFVIARDYERRRDYSRPLRTVALSGSEGKLRGSVVDQDYVLAPSADPELFDERAIAKTVVKFRIEASGTSGSAAVDSYGCAWIPAQGQPGSPWLFYLEGRGRLLCARAPVPAEGAARVILDSTGRLLELALERGASAKLLLPVPGSTPPRFDALQIGAPGSRVLVRPPEGGIWLGRSALLQDALFFDPSTLPEGGSAALSDLVPAAGGAERLSDREALFELFGLDRESYTFITIGRRAAEAVEADAAAEAAAASPGDAGIDAASLSSGFTIIEPYLESYAFVPAAREILFIPAGGGSAARVGLDAKGEGFALLPPGRYEARLAAPGLYASFSVERPAGGSIATVLDILAECARFRAAQAGGLSRAAPSVAGDVLVFKEEKLAADRSGGIDLFLGPGRHLFAAGEPRMAFELEVAEGNLGGRRELAMPAPGDRERGLALLERCAAELAPDRPSLAVTVRRGASAADFAGATLSLAVPGQNIRFRLDGAASALVFPKAASGPAKAGISIPGYDVAADLGELSALGGRLDLDLGSLPAASLKLPAKTETLYLATPAAAGGKLAFQERRLTAAKAELFVSAGPGRLFFRFVPGGPLWDILPRSGAERPTLAMDGAKVPDQWSVAQRAAAFLGPEARLCLIRLVRGGAPLLKADFYFAVDGGPARLQSTGSLGYAALAGVQGKRFRLEHAAAGLFVVKEGELVPTSSGAIILEGLIGKEASAQVTLIGASGKASPGEISIYAGYSVAKDGKASWTWRSKARTDAQGRLALFLPAGTYAVGAGTKPPLVFKTQAGKTESINFRL